MSVYGGHAWLALQALIALQIQKESFCASSALSPGIARGISVCMAMDETTAPGMTGLRDMLVDLAGRGYALIENDDDPRAGLICKLNIGSIASKSTFAEGVPGDIWASGFAKFVVVPATQSIRVALAEALWARSAARAPPPLKR